jgi:hypothetical protein
MEPTSIKNFSIHEANNISFKFNMNDGIHFVGYAAHIPVCVLSSPTSDPLCLKLYLATRNSVT